MAQFASDAFGGTEGQELSAYNASWTLHTSYTVNSEIASGALRPSSSTSASAYYHSGTPAGADYSVSADLAFHTASGGVGDAGVIGRVSTSANTFYFARYAGYAIDGWQLYKNIAGTFTQLGSTSAQSITDETTHNIKLEMIGTVATSGTVKLYHDLSGTATISATMDNTTLDAAGKAGFRIYDSATPTDTSGIHIDNFSADDITGAQTLTPSLYSDGDTFHAATVTPGAVTLTPSLFSDGDSFHAATVSQAGTQNLTPSLVTDADTFYAATVTPSAVSLTPSLYTDADTFHAATVAAGYSLLPPAFADSDAFHAATVTTGAVTLTPSLVSDADTFYSPTVANAGLQAVEPSLLSDVDTFYSVTVTTSGWGFAVSASGSWTDVSDNADSWAVVANASGSWTIQ